MTAALEIKPGKYRTRGGEIVETYRDFVADGFMGRVGGMACFWHKDGRASMYAETSADLIERIEDEPKAEDKCRPKFSYAARFIDATEFPARKASNFPDDDFHVSYGAREEIRRIDGMSYEHQFAAAVKWCAQRNLKLGTMGEWDGPPIYPPEKAELEAKIARLEAENESLSRQLRSRELNKEPASAGKVWRWSPMV